MLKKHSNKQSNALTYLFSKTWNYSKGNRKNIVWYWIMFIVSQSVTLFVQPFIWAKIINVIAAEGITAKNFSMLCILLSVILLSDVVFWSLHGPARLMEFSNSFKAKVNYRKYLLKGVMSLPMKWHTEHHSGDTIDKIGKGTTALYSFSSDSFEIIAALVKLIGSFAVLLYFSFASGFVVIGMMLITIWIVTRFDKVIIAQYKQLNWYENSISESIFDAISNITTVIILRVERLIFKSIATKLEKPFELFKKNNRLSECKWFITNMCCTIMTISVLGIYFWQHIGVVSGAVVGSVYLLITYLRNISQLFFTFTGTYSEILQKKAAVMNAEEVAKEFAPENLVTHVLPKSWKTLEIKGLDFSYGNPPENILHLKNVKMSISKGEKIAIIGETGSGKTTFLKVFRHLYHCPERLHLSIDGQIVYGGFEGISQAISLIPQNPEIFATSIIDNITLGAEYDVEVIKIFTNMACFTDVAEMLPKKLHTSIKEKGVNLSGGQQQRLALTRGLLASWEKDIVLLDEPTSSLDTKTEMKVYQNIFREFSDKTIISTVHRLHLLPFFDTIYVFDQGKIVGSGTFFQLSSSNVKFKELWQKSLSVTDTQ